MCGLNRQVLGTVVLALSIGIALILLFAGSIIDNNWITMIQRERARGCAVARPCDSGGSRGATWPRWPWSKRAWPSARRLSQKRRRAAPAQTWLPAALPAAFPAQLCPSLERPLRLL